MNSVCLSFHRTVGETSSWGSPECQVRTGSNLYSENSTGTERPRDERTPRTRRWTSGQLAGVNEIYVMTVEWESAKQHAWEVVTDAALQEAQSAKTTDGRCAACARLYGTRRCDMRSVGDWSSSAIRELGCRRVNERTKSSLFSGTNHRTDGSECIPERRLHGGRGEEGARTKRQPAGRYLTGAV